MPVANREAGVLNTRIRDGLIPRTIYALLFAIACSITFSGLIQGQWALKHDISELWWRWIVTAVVCLPIFVFLPRVLRRFGLAAHDPLGKVFLGLLAIAPVIAFEANPGRELLGLTLLYYAVILLGLCWFARNIYRQLALIGLFFCLTILSLSRHQPQIDALTLTLIDASPWNSYWSFAVDESTIDLQTGLSIAGTQSASGDSVDVTAYVYPRSSHIGLRFGGDPETPTAVALALQSRLLFWFPTITTLHGSELEGIFSSPNPDVTRIRETGQGYQFVPVSPPNPAWAVISSDSLMHWVNSSDLRSAKVIWFLFVAFASSLPLLLIHVRNRIQVGITHSAGLLAQRQFTVPALAVVVGLLLHGRIDLPTLIVFTTLAASLFYVRWRNFITGQVFAALDETRSLETNLVNQRIRWVIFLGSVLIVVLRAPELFFEPRFWAEDGGTFFVFAYQHNWLETLLYHPEYRLLISNLAALISANWVSLENAPAPFTLAGLLIKCAALAVVTWGNAPLWNTPIRKVIACVIIIVAPSSEEVWLNANGTQYYSALVTVLILCERMQESSLLRRNAYRVLLAINGLNGPLSSVLTPLYWLKGWRTRDREVLIQAGVLTCVAVIQLVAILTASDAPDRADPPGVPILGWITVIKGVLLPFDTRIAEILYEYFFFLETRQDAQISVMGYMLMWSMVLLMGAMLYRARRTDTVYLLGAFCLLVLIASLFGLGEEENRLLMHPYLGNRYFLIPAVLIILTVLSLGRSDQTPKRPFSSFVTTALLVAAILNGVSRFYDAKVVDPTWPRWQEEVAKWQVDRSHAPKIWPPPWQLDL